MKYYSIIFSILLISCSSKKLTKVEYKKFNSPLIDYFDENDRETVNDFDAHGNIKSIIQYKPIKTFDKNLKNRSKNFQILFNKEGLLLKKITYHSGNYFFQGKVKLEERVTYLDSSKVLIEKNHLLDSVINEYKNFYDNKGRLISSENFRNKVIYIYDKKNRIVNQKFLRDNQLYVDYNYTFLQDTLKEKKKNNSNKIFNNYREYYVYYPNGNLKEHRIEGVSDTITEKFNKDEKPIYYYKSYRGDVKNIRKYLYDTKGLLKEEKIFKYARDYLTILYKYDSYDNLIQIKKYDGSTGEIMLIENYKYDYDSRGNWIVKTIQRKNAEGSILYNSNHISRDITYY